MINRSSLPNSWKDVLFGIQRDFPSAVIAGGCLRDLWHGKTPKDVDIFVPLPTDEADIEAFEKCLIGLDPYYKLIAASIYGQQSVPDEDSKGFRNILAIYQFQVDGILYELIFIEGTTRTFMDSEYEMVHETYNLLKCIDINICQIVFDGQVVITTEDFRKGVAEKVLRVCNVNRADRQTKRLGRVAEKYPEYSVDKPVDTSPPFPEL